MPVRRFKGCQVVIPPSTEDGGRFLDESPDQDIVEIMKGTNT